MNIITISYRDYVKIMNYLKKFPAHMATLEAYENYSNLNKEVIGRRVKFHSPVFLMDHRNRFDRIIEIGLTSENYAKAGYIPLLTRLARDRTIFSKDIFSQIIIQNSEIPHHISGIFSSKNKVDPVHILKIQGPGMLRIFSPDFTIKAEKTLPEVDFFGWRRLIGDLGGLDVRKKLKSLNFCIVGAGRNGSLMVNSLARMGISNLSIVAPDIVEFHNVDSMDEVIPADIIRSKVDALAQFLGTFREDITKKKVHGSVISQESLDLIKESDIVISCVDNNVSRFWTNLIATFYLKPLLDIGSGIFERHNTTIPGADIQLVIPDDRCLFCTGGFPQLREVLTMLNNELHGIPQPVPHCNSERAESLRSLNQTAVQTGLHLLEKFVSGACTTSQWIRVIAHPDGMITINTPAFNFISNCPVCGSSSS
ncbi:MAG: ThiF family adenylyltransferase [Candidatus Xenobiia bacterium LiM19]